MSDGRYIDERTGALDGEGAQQESRRAIEAKIPFDVRQSPAARDGDDPTYYERPVLKEPVWIWAVPAYFHAGGVAGASAVLAAAAQLRGDDMRRIVRRGRWIGVLGAAVGGGLLVYDLGRPERFYNMLRVFRPSSPMNVGSWILSAFAAFAGGAVVLPGALADLSGAAAGVAGLPVAGYTAVLVSNTSVPLWSEIRRTLPALFVASAVSGAASVYELMDLDDAEARAVRTYGVLGRFAELGAALAVEKEADRVPQVGKALKEGVAGALWKASKACTAASLALAVARRRRAAGVLGTAGSLAVRFAIFHAGKAAAADPRATFHSQRR
jgi:DMSO reductase anchor subunit